jgi:hypothetical protein
MSVASWTREPLRKANPTARSAIWRSEWPTLLAYGLPIVLAAAAVQSWFRTSGVIATGDDAPPVAPSGDFQSHWSDFDTGTGDPGYSIVRLPYFEAIRLSHSLGLSDETFQRVWLSVLLAGAAASVVFLALSLVRSHAAAAVAGVVATFNGYRLVTSFDPVPLAAMVAAGFLGGLVLRSRRSDTAAHPLLFALASLTLGFVFVNPPHVVLVGAWVFVCVCLV